MGVGSIQVYMYRLLTVSFEITFASLVDTVVAVSCGLSHTKSCKIALLTHTHHMYTHTHSHTYTRKHIHAHMRLHRVLVSK